MISAAVHTFGLLGLDTDALLVGVADDGAVTGLAADYADLVKPGKDDRDLFVLHLTNIVVASMGEAAAAAVSAQIHTVDGHDLCRVHAQPSAFPVDATVTVDRKGQFARKSALYVRLANGTREIPLRSARSTSPTGGARAWRSRRLEPHRGAVHGAGRGVGPTRCRGDERPHCAPSSGSGRSPLPHSRLLMTMRPSRSSKGVPPQGRKFDAIPLTPARRRVLDAGRARRDPTPAQRAAVIARDRGCVGCGLPATRCHIHHIRWWSNGGPTDVDNLALVCWSCHHHIHHYDWQVWRRPDGSLSVTRPDTLQRHTA